jgi:hypothetical protein
MNVKDQKFSSGLILTNVLSAKIIKLRSKTMGFTMKDDGQNAGWVCTKRKW